MSEALTVVESKRCFGGTQTRYQHQSEVTGTPMHFSVYLPPQASDGPLPSLTFLSGLTCSDQNFITKAGAQRYAAELGIIIIAPDTSPRGLSLPGEHDDYDFGSGAGFYLNATVAPYAAHYRMYDYICQELWALVHEHFPLDPSAAGISGHSMGGHGALVLGLREPDQYRSISAFAPIANPVDCPWGHKAFRGYLGDDRSAWEAYDASLLLRRGYSGPQILIDQGGDDSFLEEQLKPQRLTEAAAEVGAAMELRMQPGYDHSYYFIASFIGDHLRHHARLLAASAG